MFRLSSTPNRITLLRSSTSLRRNRSFNTAPPKYIRKNNGFVPITEVPQTTKELSACLHTAYSSPGTRSRHQADNRRVNIVSKELCNDIIDRMKPSLLKHTGCDIIDVNPGAGVWSSAVHDLLKPRNHIMMEPDYEMYQPLLQPLLDKEKSTYKLIPKSGVVWGHLNSVLTPEYLPQQPEYREGDPRLDEPNDTLLFMANLGWHPRKPFRGFPSISQLVVHQLLSATRAHSLFHQYGLVRMLLWFADDEGQLILPRTINLRRKSSIESDISCSKVIEIASSTQEKLRTKRDESYNMESSRATLRRMDEAGIITPDGRAGLYQLKASQDPEAQDDEDNSHIRKDFYAQIEELGTRVEAERGQLIARQTATTPEGLRLKALRRYKRDRTKKGKSIGPKTATELEELEAKAAAGELANRSEDELETSDSPDSSTTRSLAELSKYHKYKMHYLRSRISSSEKRKRIFEPLFEEFEAISRKQHLLMALDGAEAERIQQKINEHTAAFHELNDNMALVDRAAFRMHLDSRKTLQNDPPILQWDRREVEPLKVCSEEFYPKQELCLLDFHPQPIWPVLRKGFPATYDTFEYILSVLFLSPVQSVREGLGNLAPGAYDWLVEECLLIKDVTKGGNPNLDLMTVRCLTIEMLEEIMEAWMRWPFRPSRFELLRRMGSTPYDPDDEATSDL